MLTAEENEMIKGLIVTFISIESTQKEKVLAYKKLSKYINPHNGEVRNGYGHLVGQLGQKAVENFEKSLKAKNGRRRNFLDEVITSRGTKFQTIRKGLKKVDIGADVWLCGRIKKVKKDPSGNLNSEHVVIYGPNNKEYHLYGKDVELIKGDFSYRWVKQGNESDHRLLKIYILTSILDKRENWCFDLKQIPPSGKLKVIYDNGTVKNIDFAGEFTRQELISKRETWHDENREPEIQLTELFDEEGKVVPPTWKYPEREYSKYVNPVAYRKF